jgi:hypothetical protein
VLVVFARNHLLGIRFRLRYTDPKNKNSRRMMLLDFSLAKQQAATLQPKADPSPHNPIGRCRKRISLPLWQSVPRSANACIDRWDGL